MAERLNIKYLVEERYRCPVCKFVLPVMRKPGERRGKGHLKVLFCPICNQDINFRKYEKPYETH